MSKIFLKALKSYRENNGTPELKDLKELIETNSMINETDSIGRKVKHLI